MAYCSYQRIKQQGFERTFFRGPSKLWDTVSVVMRLK